MRDILRKEKKKYEKAGARRPGASRSADVQDDAVISAYASRGDSPLCINTYMIENEQRETDRLNNLI